jgi:phosphotransferase system enzyme I (PtsI)
MLIHNTIEAAQDAGIPVSMCGEMAGDPRYVSLLLGMGLRELSMQPSALLETRELIRKSNLFDLQQKTRIFLEELEDNDDEQLFDKVFL